MASIVRLTGLDDFITPSQACIMPLVPEKSAAVAAPAPRKIAIEEDGRYIEMAEDGTKKHLKKAAITLTDCLACSGCVTSAESVLVDMQTYKELGEMLARKSAMSLDSEAHAAADGPLRIVVSLSPQSVASLAVQHGLSSPTAFRKICGYLKSIGVDAVYDTTFGRTLSLIESYKEFMTRYTSEGTMPVLTSACPGWICYAEKTHGDDVIPFISTVKSPQQIMGVLVKHGPTLPGVAIDQTRIPPNNVYHVTVMPCYDKKLEASREDFYSDVYQTRDVDCVITTGELEIMFRENGVTDWNSLPEAAVDTLVPGIDSGAGASVHAGGGSGGYLEYIFRRAASELFEVPDAKVVYQSRRNPDFREVTLTIDGTVKLRFASAYGMKSIQTIVRQIKNQKCKFQFVEIMACPKGCNNGGGQLAAPDGVNDLNHFESVERAYYADSDVEIPHESEAVRHIYHALRDSAKALHTQYHTVEKTVLPQLENW